MNLNQQKLIAILIAAVALIFMFLPWSVPSKILQDVIKLARALGTDNGQIHGSENGFHGAGFLSLVGVLGVVAASLMNDKMKPFEGLTKQIALASFGAIILGALIYLFIIGKDYGSGIGLYLCMIAAAAGIVWVLQLIKFNPATTAAPAPPSPPAA